MCFIAKGESWENELIRTEVVKLQSLQTAVEKQMYNCWVEIRILATRKLRNEHSSGTSSMVGVGTVVVVVVVVEVTVVNLGRMRVCERSGRPMPGDHPGGGPNPGAVGSNGTNLVTYQLTRPLYSYFHANFWEILRKTSIKGFSEVDGLCDKNLMKE